MVLGTSPPRVTATMPLKGVVSCLSCNRQARALAFRCSSSQVTGKDLMAGGFVLAEVLDMGYSVSCCGEVNRARSSAG